MKKLILIMMLGIMLVSLASASQSFLGYVKQGECANLLQTCATCTYNNISSITNANNNTFILYAETPMQKKGILYNYSFCDTNAIGAYSVDGHGDIGGVDTNWNYNYEVTLNGQNFTTGKSISYIVFTIILLFVFCLTLWGAIKVRWKHPRNEENQIVSINNFRYIKVFLFAMNYVLLMFLFGLSYKYFNEANIQGFTNFFYFSYQILQSLLIPVIITTVILFVIIFITNLKIKTNLELGL